MNVSRTARLLLVLGAFASGLAAATEPVVVLHGSGVPGDSRFSLRDEPSASCSAPGVGDCSSCSVSCPQGQAAVCKPGKVQAALGDGSCQREPVCRCDNASAEPATRR